MFGTHCKSFHPGRAAQNGLSSALLARANFTSSNQVIEAKREAIAHMNQDHEEARIKKAQLEIEHFWAGALRRAVAP